MAEKPTLFDARPQRSSALTVEQATWLLARAERGEICAFKAGFGSNGNPPGEDAFVILTDNRSLWLTPEGEYSALLWASMSDRETLFDSLHQRRNCGL